MEVYVGHFQEIGKRTIVAEGRVRGKGRNGNAIACCNEENGHARPMVLTVPLSRGCAQLAARDKSELATENLARDCHGERMKKTLLLASFLMATALHKRRSPLRNFTGPRPSKFTPR